MFALPILWTATAIGLGDYNSPVAFALAAVCFLLFMRLCIPSKLGALVAWLAPSMLSVYLIHTNEVGYRFIARMERWLAGTFNMPPFLVCIIGASAVFVLAVGLDLPRRLSMHMLEHKHNGGKS